MRASSWARAMGMKRALLTGLLRRPRETSWCPWPLAITATTSQKPKGYWIDILQGAVFAAGGLAGSGAMGIGPAPEGPGAGGCMAGFLGTRWQRGWCSSERLILGAVVLVDRVLTLQDWQEPVDPQG